MVLLTMTPAIVVAVKKCQKLPGADIQRHQLGSEPSLSEPETGKPISHGQLIDISKLLKEHEKPSEEDKSSDAVPCHLNELLRGSRVYIPPPKPRPEPTSEHKALMARLRQEEEARAYERMLNPPPPQETFTQRFAASPNARLFPSTTDLAKEEADEVTYADVNRQMALIINVLVSIIACSVAIWLAAKHWSTPQRLGLSMTGSGVVAVAEVAIYAGYIRRVKDAKKKEKSRVETKEIVETWVIDAGKDKKPGGIVMAPTANDGPTESARFRKGKHR